MNESLARKIATRNDLDKTIAETEGAYKKVRYWQQPWGQFAMVADFASLNVFQLGPKHCCPHELFELCFIYYELLVLPLCFYQHYSCTRPTAMVSVPVPPADSGEFPVSAACTEKRGGKPQGTL